MKQLAFMFFLFLIISGLQAEGMQESPIETVRTEEQMFDELWSQLKNEQTREAGLELQR